MPFAVICENRNLKNKDYDFQFNMSLTSICRSEIISYGARTQSKPLCIYYLHTYRLP